MRSKLLILSISLVLSTFVWVFIQFHNHHNVILKVPVNNTLFVKSLYNSELHNDIKVVLSGSGINIFKYILSGAKAQFIDSLNINTIKPGNISLNNPSNIHVEIIGQSGRDVIENKFSGIHQKSVKIEPTFSNKMAHEKYQSSMFVIIPDSVQVQGYVTNLNVIFTEPVTIGMLNNNRFSISLIIPDERILLKTNKVIITKHDQSLFTKVIYNKTITNSSSYFFFPNTVNIIVRGKDNVIKELKDTDLVVWGDGKVKNGLVKVNVNINKDCEILDISPKYVTAH
jgi:hypothetical protein